MDIAIMVFLLIIIMSFTVYHFTKEIIINKQLKTLNVMNTELESNIEKLHHLNQLYELEKTKYKNILELASNGILILNKDAQIEEYSNTALALLGYTNEEMKKLRVWDWDLEMTAENWQIHLDNLDRDSVEMERVFTRKDGSTFNANIIVKKLVLAKNTYIYTSITDITAYVNAINYIQKYSYLDELTGLYNRKAYNERINEMLEQYKRYHTTFSLLMMDLDFFKSINDTYGHDMGDKVLSALGKLLQETVRKNDYVFRVGGEEFIIISTGTNLKHSAELAEKVRLSVQKDLTLLQKYGREITISIGVVEVGEGDTKDTLYKKADMLLYQAKKTGRNKVVTYTNDKAL